jgi:hypothetical protein
MGTSTKKEYRIGQLTFKTKKACEEYVRGILSELGCIRVGPGHSKWAFLNNVLNNHPEKEFKIGTGVDYFWIKKNEVGNGYATMIRRMDGSVADFSWRYCCEFKKRSVTENVTRAMRNAVTEDIVNFKKGFGYNFTCALCKKQGTDSHDFHADHVHPFCHIKTEFLSNEPVHPTKFADTLVGATCFHADDAEFEERWVRFHKNKARLQILCANCNLSKSSND